MVCRSIQKKLVEKCTNDKNIYIEKMLSKETGALKEDKKNISSLY